MGKQVEGIQMDHNGCIAVEVGLGLGYEDVRGKRQRD